MGNKYARKRETIGNIRGIIAATFVAIFFLSSSVYCTEPCRSEERALGKAEKKLSKAEKKVDKINDRIARDQDRHALKTGRLQERIESLQGRRDSYLAEIAVGCVVGFFTGSLERCE
ncbi:MAG: hypothetical protein D6808_03490, partial [Candidatus Dadabacteria bacterium]